MKIKVSGKVTRGKQRGRRLDFSTVNLELKDNIESGVYAGRVDVAGEKYRAGIFVAPDGKLLEAHIIGFSGDIYGKEIEVEITGKIRDVMKFESDEKLKEQIKKDIETICSQE